MREISISVTDVKQVLLGLDGFSSAGVDEVHPFILKSCADIIALPLTSIFQKFLFMSQLPGYWKKSRDVPVFKSGSRSDPLKY